MNCWHCGAELIWGGDHDVEDDEEYDIVSNLSCPQCNLLFMFITTAEKTKID